MCEHCECEHSLGPSSHCRECDRQERFKNNEDRFGPIRDNENELPKGLKEYRLRVEKLASRLRKDQFITVRVDLLRILLDTK